MSFARSTYEPAHWFYFVTVRWGFRMLFGGLGGLTVHGLEHLPTTGPVLLAPNHKSILDPWIMLAASPLTFRSAAGRDLFPVPLMGPFMSSMGAFPLTRGAPDPEALGTIRGYLRRRGAVVLFPEGRCSPDDQLLPLLPGVAVLSLRLQVPIVPVGIRGSASMFPLGARVPRWHPLRVEFGPALVPGPPVGPVKERVAGLLEKLRSELERLSSSSD